MREAVIYTRVSSREQEQEGFSLGAQVRLLREYAKRIDVQIVQAFEDVETAKATGRKQFSNMVTWFKRNRSCRILLVEKTDRLYRNFPDAATLEDLDIEIHFVKERQVISKESKSQERLMQGIHLVIARNYSDNLREEVKKGMREKALAGIYPGHAPFGYRNNKAERTIEVHPVKSGIVTRMFELYATGRHSAKSISKAIYLEYGARINKSNVHYILRNPFYAGLFTWGGCTYSGTHPMFLRPGLFDKVQSFIMGHNRRHLTKRDLAFRGLMKCAYCGCTVTGEVKKERYVYYRCTGYHGDCGLPRFREEEIANRLGEPLKGFQLPLEVVRKVVDILSEDQKSAIGAVCVEQTALQGRLSRLRNWMDEAYKDKLEGNISEEYWKQKRAAWLSDEERVTAALQKLQDAKIADHSPDVQSILQAVTNAYSLYVSQTPAQKARLLTMLFSNCTVDSVAVTPAYARPFDRIFTGALGKKQPFTQRRGIAKDKSLPVVVSA